MLDFDERKQGVSQAFLPVTLPKAGQECPAEQQGQAQQPRHCLRKQWVEQHDMARIPIASTAFVQRLRQNAEQHGGKSVVRNPRCNRS